MSSLFIETAGRQVVDGLWTEIVRLGELWLRLVSWLIDENERSLASLPAPIAPWLVLLLILAAQAFSRSASQTRARIRPPVGGTR